MLRAAMMGEEHADNKEDGLFLHGILGDERASDSTQFEASQEYLERLRRVHRDTEGQAALKWFLHKVTKTYHPKSKWPQMQFDFNI